MPGASGTSSSATGSSNAYGGGETVSTFEASDRDSNGVIDRNEAGNIPGLDFKYADFDSDGQISQEEFEATMQATGGLGGSPQGGVGTSPNTSSDSRSESSAGGNAGSSGSSR